MLQARVKQYHFGADLEKGAFTGALAFAQRLAGDSAGAKITAEQARNILEPIFKNQPANDFAGERLSQAYAVLGDRNSALKEAERISALRPSAQSAAWGPHYEENLALIRMIIGENSGAISTLARLLEVPYVSALYGTPITPALLRLDPTWDPLRADPAFRKLYEEKNGMNPRNFFAELKRRNVYKVAVAYAVVGWLVMQVAATVVPALHLPDGITSAVVVLTLLGFPIALVIAWAFEMTPEGMKRTENVSPNEVIPQWSGRKFAAMIVSIALLAAALFVFQMLRSKSISPAPPAASTVSEKSIAVLPFLNESGDASDEYFSDGLSEELIAALGPDRRPQGHRPQLFVPFQGQE